ncbi:MAG: hypothetical protein ABI615_03000 [Chthoniobacterales bacterium]
MKRLTPFVLLLMLFLTSCKDTHSANSDGSEIGTYLLVNSWYEGWLELKSDNVFEIVIGSFGVTGKYELTNEVLTLISQDGTLFRMPVIPDGFLKADIQSPPLCQPSNTESAPLFGRIAFRTHFGFTRNPERMKMIKRNWVEKSQLKVADKCVRAVFDAMEKSSDNTIVWPGTLEELVKKGDLPADTLKVISALALVYKAPLPNASKNEIVMNVIFANGLERTWSADQVCHTIPALHDAFRDTYGAIRNYRQKSGNRQWPASLDALGCACSAELLAAIKKFEITYIPPTGNSADEVILKVVQPDVEITCTVGGQCKEVHTVEKKASVSSVAVNIP